MKRNIWRAVCALCAACLLLPPVPGAAAGEERAVRLPILMYHQISTSPEAWGDYTISPQVFEGDLEYLAARGYQTVTTQELLDYCQGQGSLPEKPVLITFDDGYESFAPYALPALEKHGMSAVMAVVGKYADDYTQTEDHHLSYSYFSWSALDQLRKSEHVELAVHTYDMHQLGARQGCRINRGESHAAYAAALNADLDQVESRFQDYLGGRPQVFAYPYGFSCQEAREILLGHGYQLLFTCEERVNTLTGDRSELLSLGRFNRPYGMSREQFFAKCL